jgi:hypothetical protein
MLGARRCNRGIRCGSKIGADGVNDPQPQHSGQLVLALAGQLPDERRFFQHPLRLVDDAPADRGDGDFARTAFEQSDAQFLLQFAHRHAQGGLADVAGFGGTAEVPRARDGDDVA